MFGLHANLGADPNTPLTVVALGAHADDIEIGCGATLLRLIAERPHLILHWAVLSGGDTSREDEARTSASAFLGDSQNISVTVGLFQDGHFPFVGSSLKEYIEHNFKSVQPNLVFTHQRDDRHQDHRIVSDLTWNTFRGNSVIAEYEIPKWDGELSSPNTYVEVDEAIANRKIALLMNHFPSQREKSWYDAETFRGLLRLRGVEAACRYAEAFICRKLVW